ADRAAAAEPPAPAVKTEAGFPWPELPPDALAPFLEPTTTSESTMPANALRSTKPSSSEVPVRTDKDPLAGLEPLPAPEPRLGVERLGPSRDTLSPPPAHPSEPVLPPRSPVEAPLGKPAFADPSLPDPVDLDPPTRAAHPEGSLRQGPLLGEPMRHGSGVNPRGSDEHTLLVPLLRAEADEAIDRVPEFGPALQPDTAGPGAVERFGSARELSAARRFDADAGATAPPQRVEPTLDPDSVTVTGDPNFPAGDDDPVYGALPPLAGERAGGERTISPAIQVWSDKRRRTAWRRTGLAIVAIALVLAGGAAAITLIRLTAADVPASELSVAEVVDRAAARLREFGLLP
ncbi:MAG TPA: hypothetical protein PK177_14540, partial [Burkholderiaceae bacterium]|nr:hypothetical protein [Burkholderiaceae bacterium]